mgnify:CR=1 FL=1
MGKISLLVGGGIGYVLGTRAGRQQYDKIAAGAQRLWRDPRVQQKAQHAQETASDLGQKAGDKVNAKIEERTGTSPSKDSGDTSTPSGTTTTGGTVTGQSASSSPHG